MPASALISVLARSILSAKPQVDDVQAHAARTLGRPWKWLRPLATRYVEAFEGRTRPRHRDVIRFLLEDRGFQRACHRYRREISIAEWLTDSQHMQPVATAASWNVPAIATTGDLADWLCLGISELEWLADLKRLGYRLHGSKLRHYTYRVVAKRTGGLRVIEMPKRLIKEVQRRILIDILQRIPPHPCAHGFVTGRSIATFAAPHAGKRVLLRLDLQDFFPGCPAARVQAVFRTLGYPDNVASMLAGLCTNSVPGDVWSVPSIAGDVRQAYEARGLYAERHLPQGAPTSPALANVIAYRLDCRLAGLAKTAGASYTRYADDLAFSGDDEFARVVERFSTHVAAIALEEGFNVNHRKTRIMRQSRRQHLAGVVVNEAVSMPRRDLELLEAILTNCVRFGPASQNRENHPDFRAHLEGRIGFVQMVNRIKGQRLRNLFENIRW